MLHALIGATLDVRGRVGRGAELLDRRRPGWADEVDIERLNLAYTEECILGQVYGDYREGLDAIGLRNVQASCCHGFFGSLIGRFVRPLCRLEFACLRDAWIAAIRQRTARERPRPRVLTMPCRCRTAEASLATAANGASSYPMTE